MPLKPGRLAVISAVRLLRSPRTHLLGLGGALFLATVAGLHPGGGGLMPAVYSSLVVAMVFYAIATSSRGFLEYASSTLGCPGSLAVMAAGAGAASAALAPLVAILTMGAHGLEASPEAALYALVLGASYSLVVLPAGTTLPLLGILYLAVRQSARWGGPLLVGLSTALALASLWLACRLGPGAASLRGLLWRGRRGAWAASGEDF